MSVIPGKQTIKDYTVGLSPAVAQLAMRLSESSKFEVKPLKQQLQVFYQGSQFGGYNKSERHWYVLSKNIEVELPRLTDLMNCCQHREHPPGHFHAIMSGIGSTALFEAVLVLAAGTEI